MAQAPTYAVVSIEPPVGVASFEGNNVKSMMHALALCSPAGEPRATYPCGASNVTLPVVASRRLTVNTVPSHAVPALPTALGPTMRSPGSSEPAGHSADTACEAHEGVRLMSNTRLFAAMSRSLFVLVMVIEPLTWPAPTFT